MVMTFTLTPLPHYNSIIKPRAHFLLSLLEDISIDFPYHFIIFVLDVYQDTATRDKLIFPSAIMQILCHFSIPITDSPYFTIIGAIYADFVRLSEAQLRPKWPRMKTTDLAVSAVPSSSTSSTSVACVTLKAIMAQFQHMDARLDFFTNEKCQVNTRVGRTARRQAHLGGFASFPFPSLKASTYEDGDNGDDEDDNASSSGDDEMTTSQ